MERSTRVLALAPSESFASPRDSTCSLSPSEGFAACSSWRNPFLSPTKLLASALPINVTMALTSLLPLFFSFLPALILTLSHAASSLPPTLQESAGALSQATFPNNTYLDRSFFPSDFVFGALTLAVKHEGSAAGKVDSIWDTYALKDGIVLDGTIPGNTGDQYSRYAEDIEAMDMMGMDAFRFSLAWTRIFPNSSKTPNAEAIAHYNSLIDMLVEKGIDPHVTLWAEDHPQALEDAYGGPLSPQFIDDFVAYANVCFAEFGDRVKYWVTFDEPNDYVGLAYASSQSPPGRCTPGVYLHGNCTEGDSSTEPYLVAHHILLAHSAAAKLYKDSYKSAQGGYIGMALWFKWYEPLNTTEIIDLEAAKRAQDFYFGWFMDPLVSGDYPQTMRTMLGPRLPSFTEEEASYLRESLDFVGINAVTATYVTNGTALQDIYDGYFEDMRIATSPYKDGVPIGEGENEYSVPWCFDKIVAYMKDKYGNPPMYITETGWGITTAPTFDEALNDTERVEYFYSYYSTLSNAIRSGGNVRGVFAWSLIDGFEFFLGLKVRFGLLYVDEAMARFPRLSAFWHQQLLRSNTTAFSGSNFVMSNEGDMTTPLFVS
ncbi:hypothetical protein L7F22_060741 [Adiantum nelumboides]|nr:hypothetical protein [Adiantum nelumboides]